MKWYQQNFGQRKGHEVVEIFIETETSRVSFSNLGARINRWQVINEEGDFENIILGHENADQAVTGQGYYYGATVGPVAGRIAGATFDLNSQTIELDANEGANHLHGGTDSIDLMVWNYVVEESAAGDQVMIRFSLTTPDGFNGYPGPIRFRITHTFTQDQVWSVEFSASSKRATLVNPTNHVYFNLNGNNCRDIRNHDLKIAASRYLPVDGEGIPTGELADVTGSPFDLRKSRNLGKVVASDHPQIVLRKGLDHAFISDSGLAVLTLAERGRRIVMETGAPAVVVYTHYYTDPAMKIWGHELKPYAGVALEAQAPPDAIHHQDFGTVVLKPNRLFYSRTVFRYQAF